MYRCLFSSVRIHKPAQTKYWCNASDQLKKKTKRIRKKLVFVSVSKIPENSQIELDRPKFSRRRSFAKGDCETCTAIFLLINLSLFDIAVAIVV